MKRSVCETIDDGSVRKVKGFVLPFGSSVSSVSSSLEERERETDK